MAETWAQIFWHLVYFVMVVSKFKAAVGINFGFTGFLMCQNLKACEEIAKARIAAATIQLHPATIQG